MPRFEGKRTVVIGGTSGIGLETAKLLIADGAKVLVTGRSDAGVESAVAQLGNSAIVVKSDATSSCFVRKLRMLSAVILKRHFGHA